jgi:hypothetical protein
MPKPLKPLSSKRPLRKQNVFFSDLKTVLEKISAFLKKVWAFITKQTRRFAAWVFAFTRAGAMRRRMVLGLLFLVIWGGLALLTHPLDLSRPWLAQIVRAVIMPDVLRHQLIIVWLFWCAYRLAATYVDDIFNLDDFPVAAHFIRQAVFATRYNTLVIKNAEISAKDKSDSPIIRIGGPGRLDVHLENAVLFEKVGGHAHVIGPTSKRQAILDGYERYRQIIDLRDQEMEVNLEGRTQDGIPITAKDVKLLFSVYRGKPTADPAKPYQQPNLFSEKAIENLVYNQGKVPWVNAMRNIVETELRNFISRHTLSEFLAAVSLGDADTGVVPPGFVARDKVTDLFDRFIAEFQEKVPDSGVELHWIGVGTWVTPTQIVNDKHLDAWRQNRENQSRSGPRAFKKERKQARIREQIRLLDQFLALASVSVSAGDAEKVMRELGLDYREKIKSALQFYKDAEEPAPSDLVRASEHLNSLDGLSVRRVRRTRDAATKSTAP